LNGVGRHGFSSRKRFTQRGAVSAPACIDGIAPNLPVSIIKINYCRKKKRHYSARFLVSPEDTAFQEPWKPGMASTELPKLAGKNAMDGFRRFLKYNTFGAFFGCGGLKAR
jgi:hypothetical protein